MQRMIRHQLLLLLLVFLLLILQALSNLRVFDEKGENIDDAPPLISPFPPFLFTHEAPAAGQDSAPNNVSISLGLWHGSVATGSLAWPQLLDAKPASFSLLPSILSISESSALLSKVRSVPLDDDPDSVDLAPTFEVYLERSGSFEGIRAIGGKPDSRDDAIFASRGVAREELAAITRPIVTERIAPFVNSHYSEACAASGGCVLCHSLIRKYVDGERMAHPTHFDVQALVTVVVSLSPAEQFSGGLYVSVGAGTEKTLALQQGDAVVHQSNLLHGVRVSSGERWSWILWFKNGTAADKCDEVDSTQWDVPAAKSGDPVAAFLVARRAATPAKRLKWLRIAASAGFARAQNELGQLLREGAKGVPRDMVSARALLEQAASASEPEGIYNLGTFVAAEGDIPRALSLFKRAAFLGVPLAAFNVGVSFYTGKGGVEKDLVMASRWFDRAGSSKALLLSAQIAVSLGWTDAEERLKKAATAGSEEAVQMLMKRKSNAVNNNEL